MKPLATITAFEHQPWCTSRHEDNPQPQVEPCLSDPIHVGQAWAYLRHTPATGTQVHVEPGVLNPPDAVAFAAALAQLTAGVS